MAWPPKKQIPLTLNRLKAVLEYDPETGAFRSIVSRGGLKPGDRLGTPDTLGYKMIMIDGIRYRASRLAWFYMTGGWPDKLIDHISGDVSDDRFANLREASRAENARNSKGYAGSGLKGAYTNGNHWQSHIALPHGGKRYLGTFKTPEEAHAAYVAAAKKLYGKFSCAGRGDPVLGSKLRTIIYGGHEGGDSVVEIRRAIGRLDACVICCSLGFGSFSPRFLARCYGPLK